MSGQANLPALSVVLVTPDRFESLRNTVKHLRAQTVRDQLELIIVAPSAKLDLDAAELEGFFGVRVAESDANKSIPAAKAAGIRAASAPLVVLGEDHSYPHPDWAEALLDAHQQPWGAVGPVLFSANPQSMIGWSNFLIAYGPWIGPMISGVIERLSEHNTSYKRALLLEYDSRLEVMLDREGSLHQELRERGYQLYMEARAKADHRNISRLWLSVCLRFHGGRVFGGARALEGRWSPLRRFLYAGGAPLIPVLRFRHVLREIMRTGRHRELLPRILPALFTLLAATAIGEAAGYLFGIGNTRRRLDKFEFSGATPDDRRGR